MAGSLALTRTPRSLRSRVMAGIASLAGTGSFADARPSNQRIREMRQEKRQPHICAERELAIRSREQKRAAVPVRTECARPIRASGATPAVPTSAQVRERPQVSHRHASSHLPGPPRCGVPPFRLTSIAGRGSLFWICWRRGFMSSYLVTGGAGFIGSHLVDELLRRRQHVRVVDSFITGKHENIEAAVASARRVAPTCDSPEVVTGDLADAAVARRVVDGIDFVLHQAAIPSVPRSVQDPVTSNRANVDGTLHILVAARDAGVKRVVYAGSSSAYGDTPTLPKCEDMPTNPLSPYALQKLVGEQYMQLFTRLYGLETVTIRYFNVFGPRQDPGSAYSGVISRFLLALTEGDQPVIYGDGEQTRDFTYVANVVDGVLRAVEAPQAAGEVMNVATGGRISLNQLLQTLQTLTGNTSPPRYETARSGDVRDSQADISKAERILGYRPMVGLDEGLQKTLAWFQRNPATSVP
jgi:nucleoside-diphosphate-sugar epimerase